MKISRCISALLLIRALGCSGQAVEAGAPAFSREGGWYEESFHLSLSCPSEGAEIRYTLDGSEPSRTSLRYVIPIDIRDRTVEANGISTVKTCERPVAPLDSVFKGTVVRARSFLGEGMSRVVTNSYFVSGKGAARYGFPVLSISVDPADLFDDERGIYVPGRIFREQYDPKRPEWERAGNYTQSGAEWERPAYLEFFEADGKRAMAQSIGVRIHGGATRTYAQKSLRLYARAGYEGEGKDFRYEIFPGLRDPVEGKPMDKFRRLILSTSGNDSQFTLFRDAFMTSLAAELGLATQAFRPAIVFVDGEYWGIHGIRERFDEYDIENTFKVGRDSVVILENAAAVDVGKAGDEKPYLDMIEFLRTNDIRLAANYERLRTMMDVEDFIDYQIAEIYFCNGDWPGNNIKFWRTRAAASESGAGYADGRWRWLLFDTDFGFSLYNGPSGYEHQTLAFATAEGGRDWPNPDWSTFLLRTLLKNDAFRSAFAGRFEELLAGPFEPSRVLARIDEFQALYEKEIAEHIARWRSPQSIAQWRRNVDVMRVFAANRPAALRKQLGALKGN